MTDEDQPQAEAGTSRGFLDDCRQRGMIALLEEFIYAVADRGPVIVLRSGPLQRRRFLEQGRDELAPDLGGQSPVEASDRRHQAFAEVDGTFAQRSRPVLEVELGSRAVREIGALIRGEPRRALQRRNVLDERKATIAGEDAFGFQDAAAITDLLVAEQLPGDFQPLYAVTRLGHRLGQAAAPFLVAPACAYS